MSKKKSLGHNPLAQSSLGYASYDFISSSENNEEEEGEKGKGASLHDINKKTASYYLEEPVISKIRKLADKHGTSYSALVNKILKNTLKNISAD
jgi:hypothetical protein